MTMYEKNLKTLADYYPEMDQRIMEARAEQKQVLEIFEETSCDGEKILKIKKDDRICYLNGKRNAAEAAQSWVKTLGDLVRDTPVLMMGIGNFSYLKELAAVSAFTATSRQTFMNSTAFSEKSVS